MSAIHVFFFRGLSTYGSDNVRFSFLDFGPMHRHLQHALEKREVKFYSVLGMGSGDLVEVTARARQSLDQHPVWKKADQPVHFLGHSAGGLVARLLLRDPSIPAGKVASCITVASPHAGSRLAQLCLDMPTTYPRSTRILRTLGYNLAKKNEFFKGLTPTGLNQVFTTTADREGLRANRLGSLVCSLPRAEMCLPLRTFHILKAFRDFDIPSDGMIERDTQPFGEVVAELRVDHVRQLGLFGQSKVFRQMCDVLYDFFKKAQQ